VYRIEYREVLDKSSVVRRVTCAFSGIGVKTIVVRLQCDSAKEGVAWLK
jgi:hypothetical protein